MTPRQKFVEHALSRLGSVVLWGQRGPQCFDCSGLVAHCLYGAGGVDLRKTHNAQMMANETPNLLAASTPPAPGDLVFYGADGTHVIHVAIWLAGGKVLSADGATSRVLLLSQAKKDPGARVRIHDSSGFRRDWMGIHRNSYLDELVSR